MRITFNLQGTGAGDNGGTATLFHSANVLSRFGHNVYVVAEKENRFTWFPLEGPQFIRAYGHKYPDADILIATGAGSVMHVMDAPQSKGIKFWWIRAHETWIAMQKDLIRKYQLRGIRNMVNSSDLQQYIQKKAGEVFPIIRPGNDLDIFYQTRKRNWKEKEIYTLGALHNERPSKRFKWIEYISRELKAEGVPHRLFLFGSYEAPVGMEYDYFLYKPTQKQLREFYNEVDFWLTPTKKEGLHIPPQEAMLCGCVLIGTGSKTYAEDYALSGMHDYLFSGETGFAMTQPSKAVGIIKKFYLEKGARWRLEQISKAGEEKIRALGDRKKNMEELVSLFDRVMVKMHSIDGDKGSVFNG